MTVTPEQLNWASRVARPRGNKSGGAYWRPLDFEKFNVLVKNAFADRGLQTVEWNPTLYDGDSAVVGGLTVTGGGIILDPPCAAGRAILPFAAWMLSNNKGHTPRFYCGFSAPGEGGVVTDGWNLGRKQTEFFDTVSVVEESIDRWMTFCDRLPTTAKKLKRLTQADEYVARDLLFEAGHLELVAQSRVFDAYKLFHSTDRTAWDLLIAFGVVAQRGPAHRRMPSSLQFYRAVISAEASGRFRKTLTPEPQAV